MKIKFLIILIILSFFVTCKNNKNLPTEVPLISSDSTLEKIKKNLIMPGYPYLIDGIIIGNGRNDGIDRLYVPIHYKGIGYEWTYENGIWNEERIYKNVGRHCVPVIADLTGSGFNKIYIGAWKNRGVKVYSYNNGWSSEGILPGSKGKGNIYSMKLSDIENSGKQSLFIASDKGLYQYKWNNNLYSEVKLTGKKTGLFGIGNGRNDGIKRVYAAVRYGKDLYEFSFNGKDFRKEIIYTSDSGSAWAVHIAKIRGDGKNRIYAWCGKLVELSYNNNAWEMIVVDKQSAERFYINSGNIRTDNITRLYVSQKETGLKEYTWNQNINNFDVDTVSKATGSCSFSNFKDGINNRLYVARGSKKGVYKKAGVVEIFE